ncbi:sulfurtransferase TusA family protein [Bacillus sp. FJAT-27445]|uniref:sulfurtransferase TusA family protein n=1 Tax=Bacillus sp. FJAT-27445 TaxID=1679166 RepID=UPI000743F484|nr:sulfurtransferase TusA family protein [Bacillus sp. FJAT-27445]
MIKADIQLDAKGLACPMPIVKTKKAIATMEAGRVLEVEATDKGSKADLKAWSESSGHQYLGTVEEGNVLRHYIRKASGEEKAEMSFQAIISNEELDQMINGNEGFVILDVREEAEFAFSHIPDAMNIPLGELEERIGELNKEDQILVVCRTGSRSDLAAQKLTEKGFGNIKNVVPGMSQWNGKAETL